MGIYFLFHLSRVKKKKVFRPCPAAAYELPGSRNKRLLAVYQVLPFLPACDTPEISSQNDSPKGEPCIYINTRVYLVYINITLGHSLEYTIYGRFAYLFSEHSNSRSFLLLYVLFTGDHS